MKKLILSLAFGIGVCAIAGAQLNTTDRNFQRIDKPTSTRAGVNIAATPDQPKLFTSIAGFFSFPNTVEQYGGSLILTSLPAKSAGGMGAWQLTGTYTHNNPSGGNTSNWGTGTFDFQVTNDKNYAITPGVIYAYNMTNNNVLAPFVAGTVALGSGLDLTPTATYDRVMVPGTIATGWVPDFMVTYAVPQSMQGLTLFADYTVATQVNGTGSLQVGAGAALDKQGQLGLKLAASMAKANTTVFTAEVTYKF